MVDCSLREETQGKLKSDCMYTLFQWLQPGNHCTGTKYQQHLADLVADFVTFGQPIKTEM